MPECWLLDLRIPLLLIAPAEPEIEPLEAVEVKTEKLYILQELNFGNLQIGKTFGDTNIECTHSTNDLT